MVWENNNGLVNGNEVNDEGCFSAEVEGIIGLTLILLTQHSSLSHTIIFTTYYYYCSATCCPSILTQMTSFFNRI